MSSEGLAVLIGVRSLEQEVNEYLKTLSDEKKHMKKMRMKNRMSCSCVCHDELDGRFFIDGENYCDVCEDSHGEDEDEDEI